MDPSRNHLNPALKRLLTSIEFKARRSLRLAYRNDPVLTTKIIDLNDDCLVKLFAHLDLQSMLNVAIASEYLRPAAREVYKSKFGKREVNLFILKPNVVNRKGNVMNTKYPALMDCFTGIRTVGLKLSLQFLRCFGPSISDLVIDYDLSESKYYKHVQQYINDYCGENLSRFTFRNMPNIAIDEIQKEFINVNELVIDGLDVGQQWSTIVKRFPNVRSLEMNGVNMDVRLAPEKTFQYLETLYAREFTCNGFTTNHIVGDLLNGAHQLKRLNIQIADGPVPFTELLTMIKDCPSIAAFEYCLYHSQCIPVNSDEVQRIIAECPALIELQLTDYRFTADDAIEIVHQLNSLKEFVFQMENAEYTKLAAQMEGDVWEVEDDDDMGSEDNHTVVTLKRRI